MEISPRKPSKRAQEPVDEWLQAKGYFRKHAPRDPTCLFRAVSEQVYMTQHYHLRVRKECVEFMRTMKQSFFENIAIPLDDYLDQMTCFTEWGGINEIQAMSLLYKREFVILNGQKQVQRNVTNNGFKDVIYLCHTPQKQYESIYTQDFVATAAYCQSIVYQVLYKGVFNMANLETTVHKMLHDRTASFRHDKFFLKGNLEIRERLTAEIYNKVESGNDELDDAQGVTKNIPPFPYRVAKALDPNIYRNTDFDIWYEIRKEVKNAGWTRHNSHELQVGGKCLIQMDFNENDFDRANNKNVYVSSIEKDVNHNDTKALQKTDKQDPIFLYGHIQEMSKNQGPVLVFIEELGEKKIVPYGALKPLPLKKSKQNNWVPVCKRNVLVDSNQKWKRPYATTSRKMKQSISSVTISSGSIDKNGNNDNCTDGVNKNNIQWTKESSKEEPTQAYENYELEKYANYSVNASPEMYPARQNLDNTQSLALNIKQDNDKGYKEKSSFGNKNAEKHSAKNLKSENTMNTDNNAVFDSYPNQRTQNENFYSPYSGEPISAAQVDNMLRSINCSVQKSVDVNGSDLPLSGLECFRGSNNWNYLTNEQSSSVGQWYQGMPQNEADVTTITNGVMQHCTVSQQKPEHNNDHKENGIQSLSQENGEKCVNGKKDTLIQKPEAPKADEGKNVSQSVREKIKDQEPVNRDSPRPTRNGLGPRFKKNSDNRHRTGSQFAQQGNQYSYCGGNSKSTKSQETKSDNFQQSRAAPQQVHGSPTAAVNSYQTPYMQQGMYSGIPYYANEAEAFANPYYPPSPGFFPMPCLPHSDMPDNGNMQQFSPHLCPGMDYAQAYPSVCPPYMCPQPAPYSVPPQNMQEHWYAVTGQPHYMPYAPVMPVAADGVCNGLTQNVNQNTPTPECITMQLCSNL
ncbi:uncharacterized protein LOC143356681 isoform X2 [Halictus rubicundus]|uniref:uncharacterized protein LOC143356681 isoform X2 n=1 Tax=Halictus rubicundus TaxID=77578 RepID=UPI004036692E